jgi:hypothetical protein
MSVILLISCSSPPESREITALSPSPTNTAPTLRRPLASFQPAAACAPSSGRDAASVPGATGFVGGLEFGYQAFGSGPAYAAFSARAGEAAVLRFADLPVREYSSRPWRFTKVIWIAPPQYQGDLLIRPTAASPAAAFDYAHGKLRPELLLTLPGDSGGYLLFSTPGCYRFQIDGRAFESLVTIEVN